MNYCHKYIYIIYTCVFNPKLSRYLNLVSPDIKGSEIIKLAVTFFSVSFLLFGSNVAMMTSYSQPQKVPSQEEEQQSQLQQQQQQQQQVRSSANTTQSLSLQLQQQQKQQPQLRQQPQSQEEQLELMAELQRLQQKQRIPATEEEGEEGETTENVPGTFTYDTDVPSIEDTRKIQIQTLPGSQLRAQALGPTGLGLAGNQTSQAPATINTPTPPAVLLNPPPFSSPLPDNQAPLQRGCRVGLYERVNPQWVTVKPYPYETVVAEGEITPSRIHVAHHEWPFNHKSHDSAFHVKLDKQYTGLASVNHPKDENGQYTMEMEWEIGTANTGITDRFPKSFWPWIGDRVWMMGRWVYDCGHFDTLHLNGWQSEIHPPFATAFTRNEPHTFPGDTRPSSAVMTYIYIHGQGGNANIPVGGRNYEFDIPMPPKPSFLPTAQLHYIVTGLPFGGPPPILTAKVQENKAHVVIPLAGIPASTGLKYGAVVASKWIDPTRPSLSTEGFRTLRVTFDSMVVHKDHDYGSGDWNNLWVGVNGKWIELSGPSGHYGLDEVDDGERIRFPAGSKSVTLVVPEKGELRIRSAGWENDNDGYYGHSILYWLALPFYNPFGPDKLEVLNDNDKIGVLIKPPYTAANNFGIGTQVEVSQPAPSGDTETAGDFAMVYRIEQLSVSPPTTRPPVAQPPSAPTQPPVLR